MLHVGTNETQHLVITSEGNVGIGTLSPTEKLDVDGNIHASGTIKSGNSITINGDPFPGASDQITASSGSLAIGGDPVFSTIKVGIGTDPTQALDVVGFAQASLGFKTGDGTTYGNGEINFPIGGNLNIHDKTLFVHGADKYVGIGTNSPNTLLELSASSGDPVLTFSLGVDDKFTLGVDDSDADKFKIGTTAIDTNTRLTIDSIGNVAIGGTAAASKLSVVGGVTVGTTWAGSESAPSNGMIIEGNVGIGTTSPEAKLDVEVVSGGAATIDHSDNSVNGDYAIALGYKTTTRGHASIAMGSLTTAFESTSTAMGCATNASGYASTAMGYYTVASGQASTAMGWGTDAYGDYSTAMGSYTNASEDCSIAMGWITTASGVCSTAMGWITTASGHSSTAMGYYTDAIEWASTAMGYYTNASGWASTAMGVRTNASGQASTAMGYYTEANGIYSTAMGNSIIVDGDHSFGIGLDYDSTPPVITQDNTMAIMGGRVGIGTVSPENTLHVNGAINLDPISAPANPSTGFVIYVDQADGDLKAKSSTGIITVLATD